MKNKFLDNFPSVLIFQRKNQDSFYDSSILLTNKTNQFILFKIFLTQNNLYTANPGVGFVKPLEHINIVFKKQKGGKAKTEKKKVLIVATPSNKVLHDFEEAKKIFKELDYSKITRQDIYIEIDVNEEIIDKGRDTEEILKNIKENKGNKNIITDLYKELVVVYKRKLFEVDQKILNAEMQLEVIKRNKALNVQKEKALKPVQKSISKTKTISRTLLLFLFLVFFGIGGFISTRRRNNEK